MAKYDFDSKRWCMSMSKVYHARKHFDTASTFRTVAEEIDGLRNYVTKLEAEAEALREMGHELGALREACIHIYNSGYHAGHHYTVEGGYVDIHSNDMDSYHEEEVAELLAALIGEGK